MLQPASGASSDQAALGAHGDDLHPVDRPHRIEPALREAQAQIVASRRAAAARTAGSTVTASLSAAGASGSIASGAPVAAIDAHLELAGGACAADSSVMAATVLADLEVEGHLPDRRR